MFKIVAEPTFTHTITVLVPADGGHEKETLDVTFRVLSLDEVAKLDLASEEDSRRFLQRVIVSLGDLADGEGNALPYSDKVRDQVLALPYARNAIAAGYFEAVGKARQGN
ncbi:MAG: hypothetical protein IT472_08825 [Thermomonas sp.]|uniref:hypothetical protein n=1 Tax=Thermomonas sp. TaxID=1971895 RepID=UPI002615D8A2|nr:hypothetical protein [Thermomonas sp.]MCC7097268.1 hypothetical protein [Thermomonas sp.]